MINRKLDKYIEQHYATSNSSLLLKGARQTSVIYLLLIGDDNFYDSCHIKWNVSTLFGKRINTFRPSCLQVEPNLLTSYTVLFDEPEKISYKVAEKTLFSFQIFQKPLYIIRQASKWKGSTLFTKSVDPLFLTYCRRCYKM